jgi:hypothetical protein
VLCARYAKLVSNDRQRLLLFSGLIFKLDGVTESISWFALCRWSKVIAVNEYIGSLLQMASQTEAVQNILTKFSELKWTLGDVQTGKESATVTANFKDPGSFSGSIDIAMKKEDNTWKIDSFDLADFSLQDASQSAQDKES